jgi:hypothetical protein
MYTENNYIDTNKQTHEVFFFWSLVTYYLDVVALLLLLLMFGNCWGMVDEIFIHLDSIMRW